MNFFALFIHRPVATILISVAITLCGILGFRLLPVAPLPQVDFPAISVSASLPGASPDTMASSVATPLERALGSIPGINRIRGQWQDWRGRPVLPMNHPAALLRDGTLKRAAWADLLSLQVRLDG